MSKDFVCPLVLTRGQIAHLRVLVARLRDAATDHTERRLWTQLELALDRAE